MSRATISTLCFLASGAVALGMTGVARASGNVCFYNGQKHDDRYGKPTDFTGEYTCKDMDTGKLSLREHHVRGLRTGQYTKYDPRSGQVEETGGYRDDKLDGPLRRYRNGVIYLEYVYARGKLQGLQKHFEDGVLSRIYLIDAQGKVDTQLHFNKKKQLTGIDCKTQPIGKDDAVWCGFNGKQSTVTLYDGQGRQRATEQYLAGREHGVFRRFNVATGALISEAHYENGKRLKDGERRFDPKGALLIKTECDGKGAVCTETQLFEDGKQARTVTVRAGNRLIKRTDFYQNGKPKQELAAAGGKYVIADYYDNGQLERKGTYVDSLVEWNPHVLDGVLETYDRDGTLWTRANYARGRRHGRATRFRVSDNVRLREEAEYDKDNLVRQKLFMDETVIEEAEYHPDGSIKSHKTFPIPKPATKI
jgi:antitoxin component YwqK of YwqJK toxin-antitoxin module